MNRVRPATANDLDDIMAIYDIGRQTMRANGNTAQWVGGYPTRSMIADDIDQGACYVVEDDAETCGAHADRPPVHGVFFFALGEDPTYATIEDGAWLNDEPYGVIHRVSSDGKTRGILASAVQFATEQTSNVRIDTHADNTIMQAALAKAGFTPCGTVYCHDGTPRIAFQLVTNANCP